MENPKMNDWFATRLLNADKDLNFLLSEGITPENSELQDRDFYKNKNKVQLAFKKEDGKFDEDAYNKFYDNISNEYVYLNAIDTENFIMNAYEKAQSNFSTNFGTIINPEIEISHVANPLKQSKGLFELNEVSAPTFSKREAAQQNKYWDNESNTWSDKTVNESGVLGLLSGKPLVYAIWDKDGTHIDKMTGKEVNHVAGEWKTDEFGNYYAETVNNEDSIGKEFVTWSEVITDDTSPWNKIDIFDSDSVDQNIPRTILKALAIGGATLLAPQVVANTIFYSTAAINLSRVLPQISKSILSFLGTKEFDELNKWDNVMRRFGRSTSDYSQEHFFGIENILNMAIDSYMQLGQQRAIATIPQFFSSTKEAEKRAKQISGLTAIRARMQKNNVSNDLIENLIKGTKEYREAEKILNNSTKLSSAISRAYLIATSVDDVYNQAKEYGFDNQTAGMISLATYGIMGALFQSDYMRSILYNDNNYELSRTIKSITKKYLDNNNKAILKEVGSSINDEAKKSTLKKWGNKFTDFFKNNILQSDLGRFSITRGALGEGIEETMEEIGQDISMEVGRAWQSLKELYTGQEYNNEYNYFNTRPLYRYGSSFIGGAIGGAVFKIADRLKFDKTAYNNWKELLSSDNQELLNELVKYTAQGKKDIILRNIDALQKTNMFSNNISAITGKPTTDQSESINNVLFNNLKKAINDIDVFLTQDNLVIDENAFGNIEILRGLRAAWLKDSGLIDSLSKDFFSRASEIVSIKADIQQLSSSLSDNAKEEEVKNNKSEIKKLNDLLKIKLEEIHRLMDGSDDSYVGRLMLEVNKDNILDNIIPTTKDGLSNTMYGLDYDNLPNRYKKIIDNQITNSKNSGQTEINYIRAWDLYKNLLSNDSVKNEFNRLDSLLLNYKSIELESPNLINARNFVEIWFKINEKNQKGNSYTGNQIDNLISNALYGVGYSFDSKDDGYIDSLYLSHEDEKSRNLSIDAFFNSIEKYKKQAMEKVDKDPSIIQKWAKDYENNNMDSESMNEYLSLYITPSVINNTKDIINKIYNLEKGTEYIQNGISNSAIYKLFNIVSNLIGENIDIEKILYDNNNSLVTLANNYLLDSETINNLNKIRTVLKLLKSIINGSDINYRKDILDIPFGANNFINEAFKEKNIPINLGILRSNTVFGINKIINNINNNIDLFFETDRLNKGAVIKTEKEIGIKYNELLLSSIKNLFLSDKTPGTFDIIKDLLKSWNVEIYDLTSLKDDNDYIKINVYYRNKLKEFENIFYNFFNNLNDSEKLNFIKDLKDELGNSKIILDTSSINAELVNGDKNKTINDATIWWYLGGILLSNNDDVLKTYINLINESNIFPFDSQENVILYISKFITANNSDFDNFKKWFVDTIQNYHKTQSKVKNILKVICSGGVGKTTAILNLVSKINNILNTKKTIFAANTINQLDSLKKSVSSNDENFVSIDSIVSDLNNNIKDFVNKYSNSIIIIDECTNISKDDIVKLDDVAEKNNIRIVMVGDTSQYGIDNNIDFVIAPSTIKLTDSKRSYTDISRLNNAIFDKIISVTDEGAIFINLDNAKKETWKYYETDDQLEGIKFESDTKLTKEYIQNFYNKYVKGGSLLVFIQDPDSLGDISDIDKNIQIVSDIKDIQGAEWDYVISDYNLNTNTKDNLDLYYALRSIYTLFTRPRHALISFSNISWSNGKQSYVANSNTGVERVYKKPIETGILNNPEALSELKEYKSEIFKNINLKDSDKTEEVKEAKVPINIVNTRNRSLAQIASGFMLKSDFSDDFISKLNIGDEDYNVIRNIIYEMATDPNKKEYYKSKLPKHLQDGVFLIKFMDSKTDMLLPFGNKGDNNLDLNGRHPWLIYKIGDIDIHLGMFHRSDTSAVITGKQSKISNIINSLEPFDLGFAPTYYNIPNNITISRSSNIADILTTTKINEDYQGVTYKNNRLVIQTNNGTLSQFETTPAFYFRKGISSGIVNTDEILNVLSNIESLYSDIFDIINPDKNKLFQGYEEYIKSLLGISQDKKSWRKRRVPLLQNKFISFIKLKDNTDNISNVIGLKKAATSYLSTLKAKKDQLNRILLILKDNNISDDNKRNSILSELDNKIIFDTVPLAFDRDLALNKEEISRIIDLINTDKMPGSSRSRSSYNNAVTHQFAIVLSKIAALYKYKNNLNLGYDSNYFNNNDADYLISKINDRAEQLIQDYIKWSGINNNININTVIDFLINAISSIYVDNKRINIKCFDNNGNNLLQSDSFKDLLISIYTDPRWSELNNKLQGLRYKNGNNDILLYFKDWNSTNIIADNGIDVLKDGDNIALTENNTFSLHSKILQIGTIFMFGNDNLDSSMFIKYNNNNDNLRDNNINDNNENNNNDNNNDQNKHNEKISVTKLWNENKKLLMNFNRVINSYSWMRSLIKDILQKIYDEDSLVGDRIFEVIRLLSQNNIEEARQLLYSFNIDKLNNSIGNNIIKLQTTLETAYKNLKC